MGEEKRRRVVRGHVALVDANGEAINQEANPRSPIAPARRDASNPLHDLVSREEMINGTSNAAIAVAQKMYDQIVDETIAEFEAFEQRCFERMDREFARRSLRGRLAAARAWGRGVLVELGVLSPVPAARLVDAAEALDPNVQAAAQRAEDDLSDLPEDEIEEAP